MRAILRFGAPAALGLIMASGCSTSSGGRVGDGCPAMYPDPTSDPQPETQPSGDPTPPSQAYFENAQAENAGSSLDEPSDNSGGE